MKKLSLASLTVLLSCGAEPSEPIEPGPARDAGVVEQARDGGAPRDGGQPRDAGVFEPPCDGASGTFRGERIDVGGEDRFYFLHVPATYDCTTPTPMLVDFHGTAGTTPEETYRTQELVALADREGFIVVRPRSRFSQEGGQAIYRWDQNPGDLDRNKGFAVELVGFLRGRYHIDRKRTYASGFSSGTNMIAQLLARTDIFSGFGFVGGGFWNPPFVGTHAPDAFRVYAATGYRDYLVSSVPPLFDALLDSGLDEDRIWFAENDGGHELYGWQFDEMWRWLDRGERATDEALGAGWREVASPTTSSLVELEIGADGTLLATTADGSILRRPGGAAEFTVATSLPSAPLTGLCLGTDGTALAVGASQVVRSTDFGETWSALAPAPEFEGLYFGAAYLNDIDCPSARLVLAAGYWASVGSEDAGASWFARPMHYPGTTFPSQLAAVAVSSSSTAVAAGYFYFGRAGADGVFRALAMPSGVDWLMDVANVTTRWWVVGERGVVLFSDDDGVTFEQQTTPIDDDLYAVHFVDAEIGMAVGRRGAAIFTTDGGSTWTLRPTGIAGFLGGVAVEAGGNAIAVGEGGRILAFDPTE